MSENETHDSNLRTMERGRMARISREYTEEFLISAEEDIIADIVDRYRNDRLTEHVLRGKVGELSILRQNREMFETDIRRGLAASEKELGSND